MFDTLEKTTGADMACDAETAWEATAEAIKDGSPGSALPPGLDDMEPGLMLAAALTRIDVDRIGGHDRVVVLRAQARMAAHFEALQYATMASVGESMSELYGDSSLATDSAAAEVEVALTLTRRTSGNEMAFARQLRDDLPQVWELFARGAIDRRKARTIANGVFHLDAEAARPVVGQILEQAPELTTGQIAARLRRLCLEADPEDAVRRYEEAVEERRVTIEQNPTGTGNLYAVDLPADRLAAIRQRIHEIALELRTSGETRTMDQLRTDVFLDLLEGAGLQARSSRGVVDIHVDLATLTALRETPGEIGGFGPVIADIARRMVAGSYDAEWRWTVTDDAGRVVATGITTRRPTAAMRRYVEARRRVCAFPGCRMPATRADMDHTVPWAGSKRTHVHHLAPLCRHHHMIRHLPGWNYRIAEDGTITWSTPLRHTYLRRGP